MKLRATVAGVTGSVGRAVAGAVAASAALTAIGLAGTGPAASAAALAGRSAATTTPIKHFIFLMQGGRTFDNYFATYPGADGPPASACQPRVTGNPRAGCDRPFLLRGSQAAPLSAGGTVLRRQYDNGKMDGFVSAYQREGRNGALAMGHYDSAELPFYWNVAHSFVLFDHFFASALYGSRTNRSYWVSAAPSPGGSERIPAGGYGNQLTIFDRLQAAGISWKFYVQGYNPHATYQSASVTNPDTQTVRVPLLNYARFVDNPALRSHIVGMNQYYKDLAAGTLPAVAYLASAGSNERSARSIPAGQRLVRNLVTQLMQSRYWPSSALMWSYDGSGGWYDHVRPPHVGSAALGLRVPALLVSPYARKGQVNHTVLDYTSALRFIEQNWRLAPLTARDAAAHSLASAFDFAAGPRPATIFPPLPSAGLLAQRHPQSFSRAVIYTLYGVAALVSLLLIVFAAVLSGQALRRPSAASPPPAAAAAERYPDTEVRIP